MKNTVIKLNRLIMSNLKFLKLFLPFFLLFGCTSPGIDTNPSSRSLSKKNLSEYSIEDVHLKVIKINNLNLSQIEYYNTRQVNNLDFSVNKFPEIYDYKYEYALGPSDVITIDLTDTDELDNDYIIGPNGNIELPFVDKVNLGNQSLNQAKIKLLNHLNNFYKNPELQIEIKEYNSSKIYVLGSVKNQLAINLNQKPIRLIDAAIQAEYTPNSRTKKNGSTGVLRRENKVYKINFNNVIKSEDAKENFFLKKNDVLFIDNNSESLHIFGEVSKPGIYFPNDDYSITELISESGINKLTANAKKVYIIRESFTEFLKINIFQLDINNPVNLIVGKKFLLKPKDIIFIPPAPIVKWNRTISLLIPQTDLFNSYNPIIQNGVKFGTTANTTN